MKQLIDISDMGVSLRSFTEADIPFKVRWINDPDVSRYLHYDLPLEEVKTLSWFKQIETQEDRYDCTILSKNGMPVGLVGLINVDYQNRTAEYYIAVGDKACWGKGVGTKALCLLLDWAFVNLGLNKVWATTRRSNSASLSMMRRIGFFIEGHLRQEKLIKGVYEDIIRVGLLREEFNYKSIRQSLSLKGEDLPFVRLSVSASPLGQLSILEDGGNGNSLYIKRDDLLGRVFGGNKLRKLEYILPAAVEQRADTLITTGSFESNHVCLTVMAAKMLGMHAAVVLMGSDEQATTLNESIQRRLGADIRAVYFDPDNRDDLSERIDYAVEELTSELKEKGRRPFFVPPAGCCQEGTYAFVKAFDELHEQMLREGHSSYDVVLAVGTGSTFSGLWCGAKRINADVSIYGISIARQNPRCIDETIKAASRVCDKMGLPIPLPQQLNITDKYIGGGYAKPTNLSQRAVQLALEKEGLLLDTTYTGKALGGLLDLLDIGELGGRPIVFWHTGGAAGSIDSLLESL